MRRTFTLLRTLGRGAHGSVHLAEMHDEDDGYVQTLAVKRLLPEWTGDRDLVARLRAEFKLLALLSHEHIVRVHGLTQIDGGLAILMEPVAGVDLGRVVARTGALAPRVVLEIVSAVADALDAAWCTVPPGQDEPLTVVHRDIKPSNVMLTPRGGVKVMDFGVARATFDSREVETRSQQFGTARYMAPERWLDGRADHKSDVFSLGVTLIEIATGEAVPRFRLSPVAFAEDSREALARIGWEPLRSLAARMVAFRGEDRPTAAEVSAEALVLLPDAPGPPLRVWAHGNVEVEEGEAADTTATMTVVREDSVPPSHHSLGGPRAAHPAIPAGGPAARRWGLAGGAVVSAVAVALLGSRLMPADPGNAHPPAPPPAPPDRAELPAPSAPAGVVVAPSREPVPPGTEAASIPAPAAPRPDPAPAPRPPPQPPAAGDGAAEPEEVPMATVHFSVAEGLKVRAGDVEVTSRKAAVRLPASKPMLLQIDEDGFRWSCWIDVPPTFGQVDVQPNGKGGCTQY